MELIKTDAIKQNYKTMKGEDIEATYNVYTLATEPGFADKIAKETQHSVRVAGFRKGKIPRTMLEKRIGTNNLYTPYLNGLWDQYCADNRILLGYRSELGEIHSRIDGAVVFTIVTIAMPVVDLAIEDKYTIDATSEVMKKVGMELNQLRDKKATMQPVTNRKSEHGDYVTIDFSGSVNGIDDPDFAAQNAVIAIGSRAIIIPGFEEQLKDCAIDEVKQFSIALPENFGEALPNNPKAKLLAGKTVDFSVTMKAIQTKQFPSDTELAKLEDKESYAALYESIAGQVFDKLQKDTADLANRVVEKIIEGNEQVLTTGLQKPTIDNRIMNFLDQHRESFLTLNDEDRKQVMDKVVPNITKSLYQDMVFAYLLAKADADVDPTEAELIQEAEATAGLRAMQTPGSNKGAIKNKILQDEYYGLYRNLQRHKTFQTLKDRVNVTLDKSNEEYQQALQPLVETESVGTPERANETLVSTTEA